MQIKGHQAANVREEFLSEGSLDAHAFLEGNFTTSYMLGHLQHPLPGQLLQRPSIAEGFQDAPILTDTNTYSDSIDLCNRMRNGGYINNALHPSIS